ncbi:MAG: CBASS cGAMP synthase, partial [Candidatus Marinimicrobia bacterium]|nr:CBASS cGAMP synthase [Candidatus Neomarinimicrobiota bacterium]
MNTHDLFQKFNKTIKLDTSKKESLEKSREALREKIKKHFDDNGWNKPEFKSQGSFDLNTIINPLDGKYDLDDGVYYTCSLQERKSEVAYHNRIINAVDGHASKTLNKNTCVRVIFSDGHHIDLPSYWKENSFSTPKLAHMTKGFIDSDPEAFKKWLNNQISITNKTGQLKRIIRYLKAWKDYREYTNNSIKLLSGFILTILACNNFKENAQDDVALKNTVEAIYNSLSFYFVCYRP